MKIFKSLIPVLACMAIAATSCTPKNTDNEIYGPAEDKALSPSETKARLSEVGTTLVNEIKTKDLEYPISVIDWWMYKYADYSFDEPGDFLMGVFASGTNFAGNMFYSTFVPDDAAKKWVKDGENKESVLIKFTDKDNNPCSAKVYMTGDEYVANFGDTLRVTVPSKFNVEMTGNNVNIMKAEVNLKLNPGKSIEENATYNISDGLFADENISIEQSAAKASLKIRNTEKEMMTFNYTFDYNFPIIGENEDPAHFAERVEAYLDNNMPKAMSGVADFYRSVQVKFNVDGKYYEALEKVQKKHENSDWADQGKQYYTDICEVYNTYVKATIHFNSEVVQALLKWEPYFDKYDEYSEGCWNYMDVAYFPEDGSSYSIQEYFDPESFKTVTDAIQKKIDEIISLFKYMKKVE